MPETRNITEDELRTIRDKLNPKYVNEKFLERFIAELPEKPVLSSDNLDNPPKVNSGLTICVSCRRLYWVTPHSDAYFHEKKEGLAGPYCLGCLNDSAIK